MLKVQAKVKPERDHTRIALGDKNRSLAKGGGGEEGEGGEGCLAHACGNASS